MLVDYAHTPDSLENVLRAAREVTRGRLIAVFGAGGDRDRGKRPLMGDAARRLADRVLVTSDNPRSEPPDAIIDEIMEGAGEDAEREVDRRRAIASCDLQRRAGRRRRDRRQGPRAGSGVRERAQGAVRRPRGRPRGAQGAARAGRGRRVIDLSAARLAEAAGGQLVAGAPERGGPERVLIDSRAVGQGDLFVGLRGASADGGEFAAGALEQGAWGVLVGPAYRDAALAAVEGAVGDSACASAVVIVAADPQRALQLVAREWRRALGVPVVGVTGSTGKTSTKDILAALIGAHASRENFNNQIGLPLSILEASRGKRGARARDGHARRGRDRRAGGDRRARRRRDRERRPGSSGAARDRRARRGCQGRADPRPAPGRRLRRPGERAAPRRSPARRPRHLDLRPGRPGPAAFYGRRPRRVRGARRDAHPRALLLRAPQPAQHVRRGGRCARARAAGRRAGSTCASRRCAARWSSFPEA